MIEIDLTIIFPGIFNSALIGWRMKFHLSELFVILESLPTTRKYIEYEKRFLISLRLFIVGIFTIEILIL